MTLYKIVFATPSYTATFRDSIYECEQHIDNISRKLPSGPWRMVPCGDNDDIWHIMRIDDKIVGHVREAGKEELS